jgi:hypothetical protein
LVKTNPCSRMGGSAFTLIIKHRNSD